MTGRLPGLPLGAKIFSIVITILVFILIVAIISYVKISDVKDEVVDLSEYIVPITDTMSMVNVHVLEQEVYLERVFRLYENENRNIRRIQHFFEKFEEKGRLVDDEIAQAISLIKESEEKALLKEDRHKFKAFEPQLHTIEKEHQEFHDHAMEVIAALKEGDLETAHVLEDKIAREEAHFDAEINDIYHMLEKFSEHAGQKATGHQFDLLSLNIVLTLSAIVLAFITAFFFTRNLIRPIRALINAMHLAGKGNFAVHVDISSGDEIELLADSFEKMVEELSLKDKIKATFGKYVDPRVVENLIDQETLKTGGEKKEMTVMFSQFGSFEKAIGQLDADQQVNALNAYLSMMSKPVSAHHGVLDKYIDTVIMAFWGPPFTDETAHTALACQTALHQKSLQEQLVQLLEQKKVQFDPNSLGLRCGIASGQLVVGNMGSEQAKSYTVLGDTVNIASRLEGVCAQYDVPILLFTDALNGLESSFLLREIDHIRVIGKEESVAVHEPLAGSVQAESNLLQLKTSYEKGLHLYREQNWHKSDDCFSRCLKLVPHDGPSWIMKKRIQHFIKHPPGQNWDGVWQLKKK